MGDITLQEAKRCLKCKKPKCKEGCPISTPTNEVFKLLVDGHIEEAGKMLFDNNPLSIVCSMVCYHENQCEGHCVLNAKNAPIHVSTVENYISNYYLDIVKFDIKKDPEKKVAIIGAGPAGITIAIILAKKGYDVTIFESRDQIGGVLRYGIPEFRLPKSVLDRIKVKLEEMGVKIRPNTLIGGTITMDDLFRDGYKAVFIGTGVWKPNSLKIKGETLGHVHFAIDYLKNPKVYNLGHRVCIIGAGNVAMDVARTVIRNGAREVTIMYRKGEDDITASRSEVEYAIFDGVKFEFYKSPVEITDTGIRYMNMKEETDEQGNISIVESGEEGFFECDSVIVSISQGPRANIVSSTKGIDINNKGLVITDEYGHTTKEGVFASGDVVTGAKTVVQAVANSKKVAQAMDEYVTQLLEKQKDIE